MRPLPSGYGTWLISSGNLRDCEVRLLVGVPYGELAELANAADSKSASLLGSTPKFATSDVRRIPPK